MVRELAESHATTTRTRFSGLSPVEQRELLDRTLARLGHATTLAHQLREPLETTPVGVSCGDRSSDVGHSGGGLAAGAVHGLVSRATRRGTATTGPGTAT